MREVIYPPPQTTKVTTVTTRIQTSMFLRRGFTGQERRRGAERREKERGEKRREASEI